MLLKINSALHAVSFKTIIETTNLVYLHTSTLLRNRSILPDCFGHVFTSMNIKTSGFHFDTLTKTIPLYNLLLLPVIFLRISNSKTIQKNNSAECNKFYIAFESSYIVTLCIVLLVSHKLLYAEARRDKNSKNENL